METIFSPPRDGAATPQLVAELKLPQTPTNNSGDPDNWHRRQITTLLIICIKLSMRAYCTAEREEKRRLHQLANSLMSHLTLKIQPGASVVLTGRPKGRHNTSNRPLI